MPSTVLSSLLVFIHLMLATILGSWLSRISMSQIWARRLVYLSPIFASPCPYLIVTRFFYYGHVSPIPKSLQQPSPAFKIKPTLLTMYGPQWSKWHSPVFSRRQYVSHWPRGLAKTDGWTPFCISSKLWLMGNTLCGPLMSPLLTLWPCLLSFSFWPPSSNHTCCRFFFSFLKLLILSGETSLPREWSLVLGGQKKNP